MASVPHRLIEGCLIAAHAIESKDVFIYIRGEYLAEYEILQARRRRGARGRALRRRRDHRPPRRRRVHLRRGDGAARLARGPPRPAAPAPAVPAGAGPLQRADADQQRLHDRDACRSILEMGAAEFAKIGAPSAPGHGDLLDLRQRRAPGQLRARARDADARADLRPRRRDRRRPRAEGRDPGRLVGAGAHARPDRRPARLRLARRARHVLRRRVADRRRRPLLHGAARAALDEVLHARVVRQVHAVPRGNALDGADPREDRARRRRARRPRRCSSRSAARILGKVALRARRVRRLPGRELHRRSGATSSSRTSSRAAARSAASRRSRGSSRRATQHHHVHVEKPLAMVLA